MKTIAIAGTFDTKAKEFLYLKDLIEEQGLKTLMINTGIFETSIVPDIDGKDIAQAVGVDFDEVVSRKDRAYATQVMSEGMEKLVPQLYEEGKFHGIISLGGSGGTAMVAPAMRALPIGVPKLIVSTMASGDVSRYIESSDLILMPSIVDVAGINSISTRIFANAAHAIAGMVNYDRPIHVQKKPLICATMFGLTTPCVEVAKEFLEDKGYEVLVFHATGTGGKTMESLIEQGFFAGVLDITTTEWADELIGGILNAGPHRLEAAAKAGVPQVVSLGALDMANFGSYDSVPDHLKERTLYRHNPMITLLRTNVDENIALGNKIGEKLNMATGPTALMIPLKGLSGIDIEGGPFHGPKEDAALFRAVREAITNEKVEIYEIDAHINDKEFALKAAQTLVAFMEKE
ncbi:MAG: UPF0261 family protein [Eubacteriaceae bacterium]|jgi:uncharacterized protein (UPF0261 family)|nr:UPF0261 family protein [Eubacteriaceae bacterium]